MGGAPHTANLSVPGPAAVHGSEIERPSAISRIYLMLANRISAFAQLRFEPLDASPLRRKLDAIGRSLD